MDVLATNQTLETQTPYPLTFGECVAAVATYSVIAAAALGGNATVVFVVFHFSRLRTPTNLLMANLALADILLAVLCIPFSYWPTLILHRWPFGQPLCKLINFSQVVAVLATAHILVVISVDRFLAIRFPLRPRLRMTHTRVGFAMLAVWVASCAIALPELIASDLELQDGTVQCTRNFSIFTNAVVLTAKSYGLGLFLIQYAIPLIVLIATYSGIGILMWRSRVPGREELVGSRHSTRRDTVKKMIPMMVLVTFLYGACWLPQNLLMNLLYDQFSWVGDYPHIYRVWWVCHTLAMSHSAVNPVVYCCRSGRFREGFAFVFRFLPGVHFTGHELLQQRPVFQTSIRTATAPSVPSLSQLKSFNHGSKDLKRI